MIARAMRHDLRNSPAISPGGAKETLVHGETINMSELVPAFYLQ